mgnify:CR=1 FL=1
MTRFWIKLEDAVSFMLQDRIFSDGPLIPSMKAASVVRFAAAVARLAGVSDYDIEITGIRPGEKIHESISPGVSSDKAPQYSDIELVELIAPILGLGAAA